MPTVATAFTFKDLLIAPNRLEPTRLNHQNSQGDLWCFVILHLFSWDVLDLQFRWASLGPWDILRHLLKNSSLPCHVLPQLLPASPLREKRSSQCAGNLGTFAEDWGSRQWTDSEPWTRWEKDICRNHLESAMDACKFIKVWGQILSSPELTGYQTTRLPLSEVWPQVHIELPAVWPRRTTCGNGQANLLIHGPSCALFVLLHVPRHTNHNCISSISFCANPNLSVA